VFICGRKAIFGEDFMCPSVTTWVCTAIGQVTHGFSVCNATCQKSAFPEEILRRKSSRRYRANMAHIRQSRPEFGFCFWGKFLKTFQVVSSSLGSGTSLTCMANGPLHIFRNLGHARLISQNVFLKWFSNVNSSTKSSTCRSNY